MGFSHLARGNTFLWLDITNPTRISCTNATCDGGALTWRNSDPVEYGEALGRLGLPLDFSSGRECGALHSNCKVIVTVRID